MERLAMETENITDKNIQKILELFPNVATEGVNDNGEIVRAIDFNKLKQELSEDIVDGQESYEFTWVGKREAMIEANRPIRKTLRPDRESSVNWDTTENIYIEGDNLDALKLLQESYMGKIKMIYIDPPYNTGSDFIYNDKFSITNDEYENFIEYKDEDGNINFKKNEKSNPRYHSDWCSMIYPRLKLARNLLSDDGVIFISIDDNEVDNLRKICDEVFGDYNFIGTVARKTKSFDRDKSKKEFQQLIDFILVYSNNYYNFSMVQKITGQKSYPYKDDIGDYKLNPLQNRGPHGYRDLRPKTYYPLYLLNDGTITPEKPLNNNYIQEFLPEKIGQRDGTWSWQKTKVLQDYKRIVVKNNKLFIKIYKDNNSDLNKYISECNIIENFSNASGSSTLTKMNLQDIFSNPKPVELLIWAEKLIPNKDFIICDFFSGSATTAHACMQLNAEDGGNRKFIMVQLPEVCDEKSEAYKAGYKNICQIGEERIRRAGKKIQEENPDKKIDIGFRVFKVDDTNMKDVYYTPNETAQKQLGMFESNIKDDRTDEDLLYGCLLDWGVELSLPHKVEVIDGKRVHIVNEQEGFEPDLIACFEDSIPESVIRKIAEKKPTRVVFRDSSFVSDDNKINVEEIFKLITPDTKVKVI